MNTSKNKIISIKNNHDNSLNNSHYTQVKSNLKKDPRLLEKDQEILEQTQMVQQTKFNKKQKTKPSKKQRYCNFY